MGGALLVLRPRFRHVDLATLRAQGADARFGDMMMMQRRAAAAGSAAKHSAVAGPLGEVVRGGAARRPGLLRHGSHTQPRHHQGARGTRAAVATSAAPAKRVSLIFLGRDSGGTRKSRAQASVLLRQRRAWCWLLDSQTVVQGGGCTTALLREPHGVRSPAPPRAAGLGADGQGRDDPRAHHLHLQAG